MNGTNALTGQTLSGLNHLRQSVRDILTTPIGTRIHRRDYGSRLFELVDAPMNDALRMDLASACVSALKRWEPRIQVDKVVVTSAGAGRIELLLQGQYLPDGLPVVIDGIVVN